MINKENLNIKILLFRFLKEYKIYSQFNKVVYAQNINIDERVKKLTINTTTNDIDIEQKYTPIDEFFQKIHLFCTWADTEMGHNFWAKQSILWRLFIAKNLNCPINTRRLNSIIIEAVDHKIITKKEILKIYPDLFKTETEII